MLIALLTDSHFGVRGDNIAFHDNTKRFLDNVFFPYIDQHNVKTFIHLGDLVDRRKFINYITLNRLQKHLLQPLFERNMDCHFICGNHDSYFRNTLEINALTETIEGNYTGFKVYTQPEVVSFDGTDIAFIPWICSSNEEQTRNMINTTSAQIAMGHLELQGFEMYRGMVMDHGTSSTMFDKFDMVMSGHYHHRSTNGHVYYLGTHGEFTWSDYDDERGFHIFDTDTRELTFIKNPYTMFHKLWYNDKDKKQKEVLDIDVSNLKGKIIKVIVTNKDHSGWFDKCIDLIEKAGALEIQVVDDHLNLDLTQDQDIIDEAESTIDIFRKYALSYSSDKVSMNSLERVLVELYHEAVALE